MYQIMPRAGVFIDEKMEKSISVSIPKNGGKPSIRISPRAIVVDKELEQDGLIKVKIDPADYFQLMTNAQQND